MGARPMQPMRARLQRSWVALLGAAVLLGGCSSAQPFRLQAVDELVQPDAPGFRGLEFLADTVPGQLKPRVNIVYVHGIGWTEDPDIDALGQEFLDGLVETYGVEAQLDARGKCLGVGQGPQAPNRDFLFVTAPEPIRLQTGLPGAYLTLDRLACMDRSALEVDGSLDIVVYRIFWDDAFWNALQFAHIGQDDGRGSSAALAGLRRKYNRRLKDEIVNYGISDAVMYLGPVGEIIREAVRGGICAAALDAGGVDFARQGIDVAYDLACELEFNTTVEANQFAFVSESLGSKIVYDLLHDALTDGRDGPLDTLVQGAELYMLANQLPLLFLSDLAREAEPERSPAAVAAERRPRIVAISEPNDLLTYELLPFLEQLWKRSEHVDARGFEDPAVREEIARRLGFDVVDLRVEFADPLVPLVEGLVDPLQAHKEHAGEPEILRLLLCGLRAGRLREEGCLAAER